MTRRLAAMTAIALLASGLAAQVDVSKVGPQVGARVDDFRLSDHEGRERALSAQAGPKGTMLVFFRSADW